MKRMKPGVAVTTIILTAALNAQAQVYKTVDEDGNVVYTDQAPSGDAEPMEMPGLSIVETPEYQRPALRADEDDANDEGKITDIRTLRRGYRDFRISAPMPDQTFWGTENMATVSWETKYALQEGMSVVVYIDGEAQPPTTNPVMSTGRLDRGEHKVRAELYDAQKRRVASTDTVTFHVKQQSVLNNRPVAVPQGGGG